MTSEDVFEIPVVATGLLAEFAEAGLVDWSGVHLARTLAWLSGEQHPEVLLAAALCLQAQESGSVCLPLDGPHPGAPALDWPDPSLWLTLLQESPLVAQGTDAPANQRPLRLVGHNLYLERNWQAEEAVRVALRTRLAMPAPMVDPSQLDAAIRRACDRLPADHRLTVDQCQAVGTAVSRWTSVIAGGPGTGKTTTIAQLLRVLDDLAQAHTSVALASFTGKAAARMQQSLNASLARDPQPSTASRARSSSEPPGPDESDRLSGTTDAPGPPPDAGPRPPAEPDAGPMTGQLWQHLDVAPATTLHSLLGARPGGQMARNADNPLPHDVVIIDEMSMVSLDLMSALMTALRPGTRLVMVGDPHQLSSVDAGAVLADIVSAGLESPGGAGGNAITVLAQSHRFAGPIQQLADSIIEADPQQALGLLASHPADLEWFDTDPDPSMVTSMPALASELRRQGEAMVNAARRGDAEAALEALDCDRLLCAHRQGRYGVASWSRAVEAELRGAIPGYGREGEWYLGRPILITRNAPDLQISNGDTGVVIRLDDQSKVAIASGDAPTFRSPWLLDSSETMHAMTVHKSQGSEYEAITLVLPSTDSPLLTRELLYTAITRARKRVRIIGSAEAITQAITTPARRATGLASRL